MGLESSECLKNFLAFFKDHRPSFAKDARSTTMTVAGKRYTYDSLDSVQKLVTADIVLRYNLIEWHQAQDADKIEWFSNFVEGTFRSEIVEQRKSQEELAARMQGNGKADLHIPDADYIIDHLQPVRPLGDLRREAAFRFIDTKTQEMTDYDYHSIQYALLASGLQRNVIDQYMQRILHIREDYDPLDHYRMRKLEDSNNVYEFNCYHAPAWMSDDSIQPHLDEDLDKLLDHLFPKPECKEFVFQWIYHSLHSRAGTYLYLCGGQGSGKNTLATAITTLHGRNNSSNPKQDSFKGRFNYYLKNKRFVFFDEFNCRSRQDKDVLKSIINDWVQVEGKNRDHEDIRIHASFFLANNSLEAIGLDPIDRRFSVPDVTDEPIVGAFSRAWIQNLNKRLADPEFVAPFGKWILERYRGVETEWAPEEPYQKSRYEEIVLSTAREGIAETLAKVLRREQASYEYYSERSEFHRVRKGSRYPAIQDWKRYFEGVRKDGEELGVVDGNTFIPSKKYRAPVIGDELG